MKLKLFQKQDLARAALHDGLILSWDTGLGKTWAIFLWLLLKVGYTTDDILGLTGYLKPKPCLRAFSPNTRRLRPKQPVLIIAPGDLHQQIVDEAWEHFGIAIFPLDSQATFGRLTRSLHSAQSNLDEQGRPIVAPDFYITSYTQLTTNGVERLPDPLDWPDPASLRQWLCLKDGEHVGIGDVEEFARQQGQRHLTWDLRPDLPTTCHFFAWRGVKWASHYRKFMLDEKTATTGTLRAAFDRELEALDGWRDPGAAEKERAKLIAAFEILKQLVTHEPDPQFAALSDAQQAFVIRHFCAERLEKYSTNEGVIQTYEKLADGSWRKSLEDKVTASRQ